jgi:hypothetical protein
LRPCTLPGVGVACYASCMTFLFTMPLRIIQVHERPTAKTAPPPRPDLNLEVSLLVDYQFIKCKKKRDRRMFGCDWVVGKASDG